MFLKFGLKNFCGLNKINLKKNKTIITTPIFYVNSKPHIGHLYSAILASAVKQVKMLNMKNGNESINIFYYHLKNF
jgi:hypothetical protein